MNIRLICLDLDGTTLRRDGTVSDRTVAALSRAMDAGVIVAIATGRLHGSAAIYGRQIGINGPIISSNGALVRDLAGKTWLHRPMPSSAVAAAIRAAQTPGVYVGLFHADGLCTLNPWATRRQHIKWWSRHIRGPGGWRLFWAYLTAYRVGSMRRFRGQADKLFMGSSDAAALRKACDQISAEVGEPLTVCSSDRENLELTGAGVSKGAAVTWLARHYGIALQDVMVAGDSPNDLSMFELDCFKVAMGNAEPEIKERASFVTAHHDQDGVAAAVEQVILGEAAV